MSLVFSCESPGQELCLCLINTLLYYVLISHLLGQVCLCSPGGLYFPSCLKSTVILLSLLPRPALHTLASELQRPSCLCFPNARTTSVSTMLEKLWAPERSSPTLRYNLYSLDCLTRRQTEPANSVQCSTAVFLLWTEIFSGWLLLHSQLTSLSTVEDKINSVAAGTPACGSFLWFLLLPY